MLKRLSLFAGGAVLLFVAALFAAPRLTPHQDADLAGIDGDAGRGTYLLRLGGCVACHTAKDTMPFAGGPAIKTPFGTFYGPNITLDKQAGIGNWSRNDFAEALLNGKGPHGQSLYPVFPYTSYAHLTKQDVADLWAALEEEIPSPQASRPHDVNPVLFNRRLLPFWQILFFRPNNGLPDAKGETQSWKRGQYIVNGPGHCAECHTPRNGFGAMDEKRPLAGAVLPPDQEKVPAISTAALKENGWTYDDLIWALKFGMLPDGDVMGGSMGEVVEGSLSHLTDDDIDAIAIYLMNE